MRRGRGKGMTNVVWAHLCTCISPPPLSSCTFFSIGAAKKLRVKFYPFRPKGRFFWWFTRKFMISGRELITSGWWLTGRGYFTSGDYVTSSFLFRDSCWKLFDPGKLLSIRLLRSDCWYHQCGSGEGVIYFVW